MKKQTFELFGNYDKDKSAKVRATWVPKLNLYYITPRAMKAAEGRARLVHGDYLRTPENLTVLDW